MKRSTMLNVVKHVYAGRFQKIIISLNVWYFFVLIYWKILDIMQFQQ